MNFSLLCETNGVVEKCNTSTASCVDYKLSTSVKVLKSAPPLKTRRTGRWKKRTQVILENHIIPRQTELSV